MEEIKSFIDNFVFVSEYNSQVKNLVTMSRYLAVDYFLSEEEVQFFSELFLELVRKMINEVQDQDELDLSWEQLNDYFLNMVAYLEGKEYYEIASNFSKFMSNYNSIIHTETATINDNN
jgi:hypothetical protein